MERERERETPEGEAREGRDHNGSLEGRKIQIINQVRLWSGVSGSRQ